MTPTQRAAAERLIATKTRIVGQLWAAEAVALLRELLAEPQGEPVAWFLGEPGNYREVESWAAGAFPVYTHPPQQRKPLSLLQIDRLDQQAINGGPDSQYAVRFARAIERAITGEPT